MSFWDSSALVSIVVAETRSEELRRLYDQTADVAVWWATTVECASAVARLERQGSLTPSAATAAMSRFEELGAGWTVVDPSEELLELARRFVRVHPLRAADALQLAAAYLAAERRPPTLELVTLDDRLHDAATREGFALVAI